MSSVLRARDACRSPKGLASPRELSSLIAHRLLSQTLILTRDGIGSGGGAQALALWVSFWWLSVLQLRRECGQVQEEGEIEHHQEGH